MISQATMNDNQIVPGSYLKKNIETPMGSRYHESIGSSTEESPPTLSITVHDASRFDVLGDLVTSQPFMREFENISDGWICQDAHGKIAACSMSTPANIDTLSAHLINWGRINQFEQRLIVLIARQQDTSTQTYRRLRTLNKLMSTYFGRKVRVCLVTKNDLLYIRPDITPPHT